MGVPVHLKVDRADTKRFRTRQDRSQQPPAYRHRPSGRTNLSFEKPRGKNRRQVRRAVPLRKHGVVLSRGECAPPPRPSRNTAGRNTPTCCTTWAECVATNIWARGTADSDRRMISEPLWVNPVLRLLNHIDAGRRGEKGKQGQREHPQGPIAEQPAWTLQPIVETKQQVFRVVWQPFGAINVHQSRKSVAQVAGPISNELRPLEQRTR